MADRKHMAGAGDASGLSSDTDRPAEASFSAAGARRSGSPDSGAGRPAEATFGASGAASSAGRDDQSGKTDLGGAGSEPLDAELVDDLGADLPLGRDEIADACEKLAAEAAEWREKGMRAQAEYENTRRRLEQRHADALLRASARVVEELFPIVDDLERAIDHAATEHPEVAEGLDAVYRKLSDVLAREGCIAIDPFGERFDPERHNAVQVREDDALPDHTCVEVFQKGYEMHGRVLRPAMVVVSSGGPAREE